MANHKYPTAAPLSTPLVQAGPQAAQPSATDEREMVITIRERESAQWDGSAAQLRAEGLIPENTEWPELRSSCYWQNGGFSYWLRRTRPPGIKGPMSVWSKGDYWMLRCSLTAHGGSYLPSRIYETRIAYENALWQQTNEFAIQGNRGWEAHEDARFQSFMSRVTAS